MERSIKSSLYIIGLIFLFSFSLVILVVFLNGVLTFKIALYLFFATLISSFVAVTILGGLFTSLSTHFVNLRRLFRLNNLTHPLLLRLQTEASGTYHHSILVANLASAAAKAIGADGLLCRVAAYFHDIGKLKDPSIFIENQSSQKDIEPESLEQAKSPLKKAKEIINHIEEGIKVANENHLPKEVISLIAQHHGTSLCSYFYDLAKEKNPIRAKRGSFRYGGPKPQTKEAAILMLADALEAKARATNGLKTAEEMVEEIFAEKTQDRQLDDCNISQGEIAKLKDVFSETLESMYHQRIEYPS